jgi:hypothetical protein
MQGEEHLFDGRGKMLRTPGQRNIGHKMCLVKKPMLDKPEN